MVQGTAGKIVRERIKKAERPVLGMVLMCVATFIFACQDTVSKLLVQDMAMPQVMMVRNMLMLSMALLFFRMNRVSVRHCLESQRPYLQILRSVVLVVEIGVFMTAIRTLSMAEMHSLMATFPLMVTVLSIPILGETIGLRRWAAIGVGFAGVLIILRPGLAVIDWASVLALLSAFLFALYNVLTRLLSRSDSSDTSYVYMALIGFLVFIVIGPFYWQEPTPMQWMLLAAAGVLAGVSHRLLITALDNAPASMLQPFNYTLLVWATVLGYLVFDNLPDKWTLIGASVVVSSGLYTIYREYIRAGAKEA